MRTDRRVHAHTEEWEIVRYDRAGKWYAEWIGPDAPPEQVMFSQPIHTRVSRTGRAQLTMGLAAWCATQLGAEICFELPGGTAFDRRVREHQRWAKVGT
jgi:hypothetical protein